MTERQRLTATSSRRRPFQFIGQLLETVRSVVQGERGIGQCLAFIYDSADWLTVYQLPGYAPELNPVEGLWSRLKNGALANLTARTLDEVTTARHALRLTQYHPDRLLAFLAETGLQLD